jgi:hypothetical protein
MFSDLHDYTTEELREMEQRLATATREREDARRELAEAVDLIRSISRGCGLGAMRWKIISFLARHDATGGEG